MFWKSRADSWRKGIKACEGRGREYVKGKLVWREM